MSAQINVTIVVRLAGINHLKLNVTITSKSDIKEIDTMHSSCAAINIT